MKKQILVLSIHYCLLLATSLWSSGGKLPTYARKGMVVTTSEMASKIGRDVLQNGGNVIDAAVATAFALAVTWPSAGNIGGGGFLLYRNKDGIVSAIDFREKAPIMATRDMYLNKNKSIRTKSNHEGFLSIGVPGTVAGLFKAHQLYGKTSWPALLEPAIKLARDGFKMTWGIYHSLTIPLTEKRLRQYPSTEKTFYKKNGKPYQPGDIFQQQELAKTLQRIQKKGPDGFYKGETAQKLITFIKNNGGLLTTEDLNQYTAIERSPVHGSYRGYDIFAMSPPSSGGIILVEMLNILEGYDIAGLGFFSAPYLHILTETMRRAYEDRAKFLGDPDFNPDIPVQKLISKSYANLLKNSINPSIASKSDSATMNQSIGSEETTHISIADVEGNAVSMTYTLEYSFGSGIVAEGLGFLLNNEMGDFNAVPGLTNHRGSIGTLPNQIEPQKRMLSSMTPTIVAKNGKLIFVLGSPGGRTIINTVLQVIINLVDFKMNIAEAVEAGRIHHQWLPDTTYIEKYAISQDTERIYLDMGHTLSYRSFQGRVMGIAVDYPNGIISGTADSRSPDGAAVGH